MIPLVDGRLVINEQITSRTEITVNALHLTINDTADVVVASALAGFDSNTDPADPGGDHVTGLHVIILEEDDFHGLVKRLGSGKNVFDDLLAAEIAIMVVAEIVGELMNVVGLAAAAPYSYLLVRLAIDLAGTAVQLAILVTAFPHFLRETV